MAKNSIRYGLLFLGALFAWWLLSGTQHPVNEYPSSHHTAAGFRNLHTGRDHGLLQELRWHFGLGPKEAPDFPQNEVPAYVPDVVKPDLERIQHPDPSGIQITWIGQACFLIQTGSMNILTDPVFSDRASPFSFVGPKRVAPPGVPLCDLPPIQAVVISHNHFDHLDLPTVRKLGNAPRYFVPPGLGAWFAEEGITNVVELDWWVEARMGPFTIIAVPAQHFSARTLFDRDRTLWAGWVIKAKAGTIFFAGCSGYAPEFREIGRKFGPIRISLLPIGGYRPRWFMRTMHMDPPEAVKAHQDLGSNVSIAMHWGTFRLTDEPLAEPPLYLKGALKEAGVSEDRFIVMKIGETRVFTGSVKSEVRSVK
jgi:N-acyl-phosphatidylethanolamine-hydrolysing phospholipase D